jgi:twinkle protein
MNFRGISQETIARWPVQFAPVGFPDEHGVVTRDSIVFHYLSGDAVVNWKARTIGDPKLFTQMKGGQKRFWNLDRVLAAKPDLVYVTEGEMDALSLAECGIPDEQILGFGGGAPGREGNFSDARYAPVVDALEAGLDPEKFCLVIDNDAAGNRLKSDLAHLLGVAKCMHVELPQDFDVNDELLAAGPESLKILVSDGMKDYPIIGLYTLETLPETPPLEVWSPGFPEWESRIKLASSTLSVMTGYPGHGKTLFSQQLWFQIARQHDFPVAIMSAETPARPYVRRAMRQFYSGMLEHRMKSEELVAADNWIQEHIQFIAHPNHRPTFEFVCDMIEAAAKKYGCRAVIIDPWNKLEQDIPRDKTETQWIGDCLDYLLDLARGLRMHVQVLAHPAKPDQKKRGTPPDLYQISGSANWYNRPDQGFVIHRPEVVDELGNRQTTAHVYHSKARFEELGYASRVYLRYNLELGRFEATL